MNPRISLLRRKFGKLRVLSYAGKAPNGVSLWNCKCECGTEKEMRYNSLVHGGAQSCGCGRGKKKTS